MYIIPTDYIECRYHTINIVTYVYIAQHVALIPRSKHVIVSLTINT